MNPPAATRGTLVRNYTFTDKRLQTLWHALTGDDIPTIRKQQSWWPDYPKHVDLRHAIVHRGQRATKEEGAAICHDNGSRDAVHPGDDSPRWRRPRANLGDKHRRPPWHDLPAHDRGGSGEL